MRGLPPFIPAAGGSSRRCACKPAKMRAFRLGSFRMSTSPATAPFRIETPRLCIRAWRPADRAAFAAMAQDAALMTYVTDGQPMSEGQIDASLERQARNLQQAGYCMGAAEWIESGEVIGVIGLQPLDRDPAIDIGWWVRRDHQGRGLATEAALALQAFLHARDPSAALVATIHPDNLPSQAVARRLGLETDGITVPASRIASWRPDIPVLLFRPPV